MNLPHLLRNSIILNQIAPYLAIGSILSLAASCKTLRQLLRDSPEAYHYLDLSRLQSATVDATPIDKGGISWRAERMDEALTEADFYCGPLRGIFSRLRRLCILQHVSTLVLDGLCVPAELVQEIISTDTFNVRILSIRSCTHVNERTLNQALRYAVRPSRPKGTPKLRALYVFGSRDSADLKSLQKASGSAIPQQRVTVSESHRSDASGVTTSEGAVIGAEWNRRSSDALSSDLGLPDDLWYRPQGKRMKQPSSDWIETVQACEGIIAFDAVLCRGPRHATSSTDYLKPAVATIALGTFGCDTCNSCPEGPAIFGQSTESYLPLLTPPPLRTPTVRAAQRPSPIPTVDGLAMPRLMVRCEDCLRGRWCERCNKWWCEDCYDKPVSRAVLEVDRIRHERLGGDLGPVKIIGVHRDCFDCGRTCAECKARYIRQCKNCKGGYCVVDHEGSTETTCDWCSRRGRLRRELY